MPSVLFRGFKSTGLGIFRVVHNDSNYANVHFSELLHLESATSLVSFDERLREKKFSAGSISFPIPLFPCSVLNEVL